MGMRSVLVTLNRKQQSKLADQMSLVSSVQFDSRSHSFDCRACQHSDVVPDRIIAHMSELLPAIKSIDAQSADEERDFQRKGQQPGQPGQTQPSHAHSHSHCHSHGSGHEHTHAHPHTLDVSDSALGHSRSAGDLASSERKADIGSPLTPFTPSIPFVGFPLEEHIHVDHGPPAGRPGAGAGAVVVTKLQPVDAKDGKDSKSASPAPASASSTSLTPAPSAASERVPSPLSRSVAASCSPMNATDRERGGWRFRPLVIGYAFNPKKLGVLVRAGWFDTAYREDVRFVKIELGKPMEQQGPFDIVLQKLTDLMVIEKQDDADGKLAAENIRLALRPAASF